MSSKQVIQYWRENNGGNYFHIGDKASAKTAKKIVHGSATVIFLASFTKA